MTSEEIEARLAELRRKLAVRKGQAGYAQNAKDIEAEIERLTTELENNQG